MGMAANCHFELEIQNAFSNYITLISFEVSVC